MYRIIDHLGSGQFGSVNKGLWKFPAYPQPQEVAVKIMKASTDDTTKVRFLQEAAIMGQFFHPNVVKLHGVVTVGDPVSFTAREYRPQQAPPTSTPTLSTCPFMSVVGPHLQWSHHGHKRAGRRCDHGREQCPSVPRSACAFPVNATISWHFLGYKFSHVSKTRIPQKAKQTNVE